MWRNISACRYRPLRGGHTSVAGLSSSTLGGTLAIGVRMWRDGLSSSGGWTVPNRLLYSCRNPSCPNKVKRSGYCPEHGGSKRAHPSHYQGAWPGIRAQQLQREPRCRVCGQPATEVDHMRPLTPVPGSGLAPGTHDPSNLQSLCTYHARAKTGQENLIRFGRGGGVRASA
jgi:hypothetical protein